MNGTMLPRILVLVLLGCHVFAFAAAGAAPGTLQAGAARIDITPAADAPLPMSGYGGRVLPFTGIHDNLHVRAIVVDDGASQAALIGIELIGLTHDFWERMTGRLARETGIPAANILLAGVHTHAAPAIGTYNEVATGDMLRRRTEYVQRMENALVEAVRQAKASLQPARIGFGTGQAKVNMNRRARNGTGGWMLGHNPDGVSDKTVAVVRIDTMAGAPLAILSNYSVHGTVLGPGNMQISADLPGATARVVEKHFGEHVVSPWTSAAAGDQDPIYRVGVDFRNLTALGQILGEEVIRVAEGIKTSPRGRIRAVQRLVTCPAKRPAQFGERNKEFQTGPIEPVPIRLSLLLVNDIAITGVSGEVLTNIALRLKRESPLAHTLMVTHCNGSSGYIPDDAAYEQPSYEISTSRLQAGCAEDAIVNGLVEMIGESLF